MFEDEGVTALRGAARRLGHLQLLDLSDNYLTRKGTRLVDGLAARVVVEPQKKPNVWEEQEHRYVSVGESPGRCRGQSDRQDVEVVQPRATQRGDDALS